MVRGCWADIHRVWLLSVLAPVALLLLMASPAMAQSGAFTYGAAAGGGAGNWPGDATACNDGTDNDSDGIADWPGDAGCTGPYDTSESGDATVVVSGNVTAASLNTCIGGSNSTNCTSTGASSTVTVRPNSGTQWVYDVTSSFSSSTDNVSFNGLDFTANSSFGGDDQRFVNSRYIGPDASAEFDLGGVDGFVIYDSYIDGGGTYGPADTSACYDNQIWTVSVTNLRVLDSTVIRYCNQSAGDHAEMFFIGGFSSDMLFKDNTFDMGGSTAHMFFTYFGDSCETTPCHPRRICVKGNTFGERQNDFYDVSHHENIGSDPATDLGITVEDTGAQSDVSVSFPTATCKQCNDGLDNDSDGRADYWVDGNGDTNCADMDDNSE